MRERELRREKTVEKFAEKRKALKAIIKNADTTIKERMAAQIKLQQLPRDSAPVRLHNRCSLTGRPHGFYRRFGLGRNMLRKNVMLGNLPGVVKSSW